MKRQDSNFIFFSYWLLSVVQHLCGAYCMPGNLGCSSEIEDGPCGREGRTHLRTVVAELQSSGIEIAARCRGQGSNFLTDSS